MYSNNIEPEKFIKKLFLEFHKAKFFTIKLNAKYVLLTRSGQLMKPIDIKCG